MPPNPDVLGSSQHDTLSGTGGADVIVSLAGDDSIDAQGGADRIHGDFLGDNLLEAPEGALSLSQYGAGGAWTLGETDAGFPSMSQQIDTIDGAPYEVSFEHAATYAAGTSAATITLFWNDTEIGQVDTSSAVFSEASFSFTGTGDSGTLTFEVTPTVDPDAPEIFSDGPISYYLKTMDVGGTATEVKAFAEGQAKIYQVMDGRLHVFDPETETYTPAGAEATVVVNAIGFNPQDDMLYGIAVKPGVDSQGTAIARNDLVMYDADGATYRMGETPYRSWTGDFDDQGNLWYFESDFDRVTKVDVDAFDADGNPLSTTYKFPTGLITDKVWDVGFDAASQSFYGLVKPGYEGGNAKLFQIDISQVADGGAPSFATTPVTGTRIDGALQDGVPNITFGAFVVDGDGNFYAGGNGGDHDMNDATGISGGIYRVLRSDTGEVTLELVSDAPRAYSNDGAVDARAMDPFAPVDPSAIALIRGPELYAVQDPAESYDDTIAAGSASDTVSGGYGEDSVTGGSAGDVIDGNDGDDILHGGNGPGAGLGILSVYDENGLRYDQFGNLLLEDDDVISGGAGNDLLAGAAGHDLLDGGTGADTLDGGTGHDTLSGGQGADQLSGGREDDLLSGGADDDTLAGGSGDDTLSGDDGADQLNGGAGDDLLSGGAGADRLLGRNGADDLSGDAGADTLKGGSGNDTLDGGAEDDRLDGGAGDDVLIGGSGSNTLRSGSGDDTVTGGDENDYINAHRGDDVIDAGGGNDRVYLGAGSDVATGGAGSDRFVFRFEDLDGSTDVITDFTRDASQSDRLDFRSLDLLAQTDAETWLSDFTSVNAQGAVEIALDAETVLVCEGPESGLDLLATVHDGIMF